MNELATRNHCLSLSTQPLSLRANTSWTIIGNAIYAASSFGILVILAKLGTTESVGEFALGLAITAPVIEFAKLQLRAIQATDLLHDYLFRDYFGLRLITLGAALVTIASIGLISSYSSELALTILVIGIGKAVDAVSDVIYGALQQQERMDCISVSLIVKGVLSLIMLGGVQYITHSVLLASAGWTLASIIVVLSYDIPNGFIILRTQTDKGDYLFPRFNRHVLKRLTFLSLPLGIAMLLISLNTSIPRYFVESYSGQGELGMFAAMAYLMIAGNTVIFAIGQAASPRLAMLYIKRDRAGFQRLLLRLIVVGLILGVTGISIAVLAGRPLLALLYQPEYAEENDSFILLMIAGAISYVASFLGYSLTASRHLNVQPFIFALCVLCSVLSCMVLVPVFGIRWSGTGYCPNECRAVRADVNLPVVCARHPESDSSGMTKRILQVVGSMNRGGTETWLMHVLRHIDRENFQFDFLVHGAGTYDDEIGALGSKVILCSAPRQPLRYGHTFKRICASGPL